MGVVVGDDGELIGYEGVYVCDASVFPTIPDVTPSSIVPSRTTRVL